MNSNNGGPFDPNDLKMLYYQLKQNSKMVTTIFIIFIVAALGLTSFYTVAPDEEAVIIRLGKYLDTYPPGPHFKLPFGIDKLYKERTKRVHQAEFGFRTVGTNYPRSNYSESRYDIESIMLTGDLNVADVEWVVQFQISNPFKFRFQTNTPIRNIRDVSESIMRRVVGDRLVTDVLTTGRVEVANEAQKLMQKVLDRYDMGVRIVTVKLQDVNPPEEVKASFNEVNEAKQEQEKLINQAEKAYNKVIPEARGKAEETISWAQGYAQALLNKAQGDATKFKSVLSTYRNSPNITRKRLYLETMEEIYKKVKKITIVDSKIKGLLPVYSSFNNISKNEGTK